MPKTPTKFVDESRAAETNGQWADGTPRPTDYAFGVQCARRDCLLYGPYNIPSVRGSGDFAEGWSAAVLEARAAVK